MKKTKRDPWKMILAATRDLEQRLRLHWPINYKKDDEAVTCKIASNPLTKRHVITLPSRAAEDFASWRPSAAHELCHAWLAENVDPIFATWKFPRRYSQFVNQELAEFEHRAREMYLAASFLMDVWVNDLRHDHWPELSQQEVTDIATDLQLAVRGGHVRKLCDPNRVMAIVLHVVCSERHGGRPAQMKEVYEALPGDIVQVIHEAVNFMRPMPRLPTERHAALRMLEQYVQQLLALLNASFVPRLVEEDGLTVWEIMK